MFLDSKSALLNGASGLLILMVLWILLLEHFGTSHTDQSMGRGMMLLLVALLSLLVAGLAIFWVRKAFSTLVALSPLLLILVHSGVMFFLEMRTHNPDHYQHFVGKSLDEVKLPHGWLGESTNFDGETAQRFRGMEIYYDSNNVVTKVVPIPE